MKKSDINKRPAIITNVSSTSWSVEYISGALLFSQGSKIVNPKPSTFLEGNFRCFVLDGYYQHEVDKDGIRVYRREDGYMTYQEAIAIAKRKGNIRLVKETTTYYNTQTKELNLNGQGEMFNQMKEWDSFRKEIQINNLDFYQYNLI